MKFIYLNSLHNKQILHPVLMLNVKVARKVGKKAPGGGSEGCEGVGRLVGGGLRAGWGWKEVWCERQEAEEGEHCDRVLFDLRPQCGDWFSLSHLGQKTKIIVQAFEICL